MTKKATVLENGVAVRVKLVPDDYAFGVADGIREFDPVADAALDPDAQPTAQNVENERDRRLGAGFVFNGNEFDSDMLSIQKITGSALKANIAILGGAVAGDLRWFDPSEDFDWIAKDNTKVPLDAHDMAAMGDALAIHQKRIIYAARTLKDSNPIPSDFASDIHWP